MVLSLSNQASLAHRLCILEISKAMMLSGRNSFCSFSRRVVARATATTISAPSSSKIAQASLRWLTTINSGGKGHHPHAFFEQQIQELEQERTEVFGEESASAPALEKEDGKPMSGAEQHAFFQAQVEELEYERQSVLGPDVLQQQEEEEEEISETKDGDDDDEFEFLHEEREAVFQFSDEEKQAWSHSAKHQQQTVSTELLQEIELARQQASQFQKEQATTNSMNPAGPAITAKTTKTTSSVDAEHHESFSHVSVDGASVHMVDVGHKDVTTRTARAQTKVLLPDEVLEAFSSSTNEEELIGPKGPIFATAKLAGIMAAK